MNNSEEKIKSILDIERSIIKTYRRDIYKKFVKAVNKYELVEEGDKIAVAISGGKDSLTLAKLMQELKRHNKVNFELEFIAMDPGYLPENRQRLEYNCEKLGIPVKVHDSDVFEVANKMSAGGSPCYMCARMRRGNLYNRAQELGCNKLALGHHFNDVIETVLLNIIFAGDFKTMMPKLRSQNFEGLELIRPMYLVEEEAIIRFMKSTGLSALDCACTVTQKKSGNKRFFIKDLIEELKKENKNVDINILRATENVNMEQILGFKSKGERHDFTEFY
ncbi:tRNA 2-thiocytidine(32) synthetase TtcA [Peptoniphilus sp. MSJ-1]|uniref:tRNA 2-thiocytidine(32) synthetase TtcA n=1 Tax=Peptoniphilus ovalis TaxID=2841503 RepID=A0ABS6FFH2_9FIRM|nr:ATP-binding protein [Peptoniphilus ovalis]MBU5668282.1 tRNA 2-thiocytidine(32) synthetase TtcA [Peptoniphilus ovalis]